MVISLGASRLGLINNLVTLVSLTNLYLITSTTFEIITSRERHLWGKGFPQVFKKKRENLEKNGKNWKKAGKTKEKPEKKREKRKKKPKTNREKTEEKRGKRKKKKNREKNEAM